MKGWQLSSLGGLSDRVTVPAKPLKELTLIVETAAVDPSATALAGDAETEKSGVKTDVKAKAIFEVRTSGPLVPVLVPVTVTE